ncbi:MAG TPA: hypothetical protein VFO83_07700, partial [Aggregicoccus sp.]|nr:hypothetical protein [Aggregicoccus sp.]
MTMRHPIHSLPTPALTLTFALLLACGGTDEPRFATACIGVSCTAGYCVDEGGVASCHCGPAEQQQGLSCEIDEVGDLDSQPEPTLLQVPTAPTSARLHRWDTDTYAFDVVAGRAYRFTCSPQGFTSCALRPYSSSFDYSDPGALTSQRLTREGNTLVSTVVAQVSGRL